MTEPTEPQAPDAAESEPPMDSTDVAEPETTGEPATVMEPVTLPDESNSRTTELAARLRQSALAQVEAARAARAQDDAADDDPPQDDAADDDAADDDAADDDAADEPETAAPEAAIPALDDAQVAKAEPHFVPEPQPESSSEPIAVAAAAMAEAAAGSEQSVGSDPVEPEQGRMAARVRLATIAAAALTLAAVVVLLVFARTSSHNRQVDKARADALAAAKTETALALTYDYRTLDADFATAEKGMSKSFRAKYAQTAATEVTPLARQTQAVTSGTVAAAGVISATSSTVRVLVFADQTNTNKLIAPKSRLDSSAIEVTMVKQDGRWVIDDLKPF